MIATAPGRWLRRAQPLLGTLVEIGALDAPAGTADASKGQALSCATAAAFAAIRDAQACLSRFEPDSDLSRFHALRRGQCLTVRTVTRDVLAAVQWLHHASDGLFDISLGSATDGWALSGSELEKRCDAVRLDLGGIGKGHAVDLAVRALRRHGLRAGWVNAGGDLRVFGDIDVPLQLRDETQGGVRPFARLHDGAFATSAFGHGHRARLAQAGSPMPRSCQVSVAAPQCLWADALTKVVAATGDVRHWLLAQCGASAWLR
ncbi:MAG: FAD:protein FMN transferase [Ideonella sp.]|nr:FAD:protein FMN transferase [Ideonella sp.]